VVVIIAAIKVMQFERKPTYHWDIQSLSSYFFDHSPHSHIVTHASLFAYFTLVAHLAHFLRLARARRYSLVGHDTPCRELEDVIEHLMTPAPEWLPVALTSFVSVNSTSGACYVTLHSHHYLFCARDVRGLFMK
jgi:hypothetical protein